MDPLAHEVPLLPRAQFACPGPLRDQLVAAILDGRKTGTTALLVDHELHGQPLPAVGDRSAVVDSADAVVAVLQVTDVRVMRLGEVPFEHVLCEGEGHASVAEWRSAHEGFWHSDEMRAELGDPTFAVDDATPVVLERFRLLHAVAPASSATSSTSKPSSSSR